MHFYIIDVCDAYRNTCLEKANFLNFLKSDLILTSFLDAIFEAVITFIME